MYAHNVFKLILPIQYMKNLKGLELGRKLRKRQLEKYKKDIPKITKIINGKYLDLEKWFCSYKKLIDFGTREFKGIYIKEDRLILKYTCFSKGKKKSFITTLPQKIKIDKEFLYFFGLWVGDKSGGRRIGIVNKNKEILDFTENYLKKLSQKIEKYLYIGEKEEVPNKKVDRIFRTRNKDFGYSISIHSTNGILKSFFEYLEKNFLEIINTKQKTNIFLSGLFDAEGNISLEDKCFRWGCKDKILLEKLIGIYKKLDIFRRYDGSNIISYDKEFFLKYLLPFIKNKEKINRINLITNKTGKLDKRFINILIKIKGSPKITNKELAKTLKRTKVHAQTRFLTELNYIETKNYPKMLEITNKGKKAIDHFQGRSSL